MRNAIRWTLAFSLFAIAAISPVLGNAHAKQPHLVIGTGVGIALSNGGYPAVLYADTGTDSGTVIATIPSSTGPQLQTITLNCTHVVRIGGFHGIHARGKSQGKTFYIYTNDVGPYVIYISRTLGSGFPCGAASHNGYQYAGAVTFVNQ